MVDDDCSPRRPVSVKLHRRPLPNGKRELLFGSETKQRINGYYPTDEQIALGRVLANWHYLFACKMKAASGNAMRTTNCAIKINFL